MKPSWHLFSRITLILFRSSPSAKLTIFTRNWICQYCFLWCQRSNKISFRRSGRTQESNVVDAVWRPSWKYGCKLKDSSAFLVLVYLEWTYIGRYPQWCLFFRDHSSGRGGGINFLEEGNREVGGVVISVLHNGSWCFLVLYRTFQRRSALGIYPVNDTSAIKYEARRKTRSLPHFITRKTSSDY